jgi:lipopolysaccharide export system permease protein
VISRLLRPLDRYVFAEWVRIFVVTALGFPLLVVIIDLTDNLDKYLSRQIPYGDLALSYLYWLPDSMFMILPAAVLFATVFTIGSLTRYSEITAAKASGISFYRMIAPIAVGAVVATGLGLLIGEVVPKTNSRRQELLRENEFAKNGGGNERFNFAYAAERGRVYKAGALVLDKDSLAAIEVERRGRGASYPSYILTAQAAKYTDRRGWTLRNGDLHFVPDSGPNRVVAFDSLVDRRMTERPMDLMASPRAPQEMGYRELGRFIAAMERSGGDVNELRVERMLKIAIPVTCVVIFLFGAPLATSTQRGGAAYGIGVSLGTTVVFLMLIQLMKAVGGKGLLTPELAAWMPSLVFAIVGAWAMARVRT